MLIALVAKGDYFWNFLFRFLDKNSSKKDYTQRKEFAIRGANSSFSELFPIMQNYSLTIRRYIQGPQCSVQSSSGVCSARTVSI